MRGPGDDSAGTEAAARVADVLLLFVSGPTALGVSAISRELGLSKAVVHRILRSLASRGLIEADRATRGYRLGPAGAALGARALRDSSLRTAALPVLRRLRDATGETTTLTALVGTARVYLEQCESPQEIKMTVETGRRLSLHAGASSRAILAFLPEAQREAVLHGPMPALTQRTVVDPERLRGELDAVRRDGVSITLGERQPGAGSVAAPVFGFDGEVVGAISVCGPVDRFDPATCARYTPLARSAAAEISHALGWTPDPPQPATPRSAAAPAARPGPARR